MKQEYFAITNNGEFNGGRLYTNPKSAFSDLHYLQDDVPEWVAVKMGVSRVKVQVIEDVNESTSRKSRRLINEDVFTARQAGVKNLDAYCDKIQELLDSKSLWAEVEPHGDIAIKVRIEGDWKHDHIYGKRLITQNFPLELMNTEIVGDDDSDSYTADYYFLFNKENVEQ